MKYKNKNPYIGIYPSEILAARIYDIVSIKAKGIKANTNFIYSNNQILSILNIFRIVNEIISHST